MLTRSGRGMSMRKAARQAGLVMLALGSASAWAQPSQDELLRLGTLATLAPLCGVRDETWAFDLRRAELQDATRSRRFDDQALRAAPGSEQATAALSFAEDEALEQFADSPAERTCAPLANAPDLKRADEIVRAFRAQRDKQPGS